MSLDDLDVRFQAERSPADLVANASRLTLDEVQRVPELMPAVKRAVDEDRRRGQFLLAGSANLLLMRQVSESLAGRASYLVLRPLTRREQAGEARAGSWGELFETPEREWARLVETSGHSAEDWREVVRRGGYPTPALELGTAEEREIWFDGYVRTYLERDLQELSSIENLAGFQRLMSAAVQRLGQLVNQTELGRDVQLPQPTVHRWLNLLETSWQLERLPAYAVNRTKRLIKSPKLYWSDTGLALHLSGATEPAGAHLENLVLTDLLAWRDAMPGRRPGVFYWRTSGGAEVDFVVESRNELLAIEVKSTGRPSFADARNLVVFRDEYPDRLRGCLLLHTGSGVTRLGDRLLAVPWWMVM